MSTFESRIDDLYRLPLPSFTDTRNALAKTVSKEEAKIVKRLAKPTTSAWAANQVYWRARPVAPSASSRPAQNSEPRSSPRFKAATRSVRPRSDAHRKALSEAVAEATRLAAEEGGRAGLDELTRMFEAVSLVPEHPELARATDGGAPPDRVRGVAGDDTRTRTRSEAPAHETVAGKDTGGRSASSGRSRSKGARRPARTSPPGSRTTPAKAAIASAEHALERARAAEMKARGDLDRAQRTLRAAEAALRTARGGGE